MFSKIRISFTNICELSLIVIYQGCVAGDKVSNYWYAPSNSCLNKLDDNASEEHHTINT